MASRGQRKLSMSKLGKPSSFPDSDQHPLSKATRHGLSVDHVVILAPGEWECLFLGNKRVLVVCSHDREEIDDGY